LILRLLLGGCCVAGLSGCALAQNAPPQSPDSAPVPYLGPSFRGQIKPPAGTLTFKYENPQLQPAKYLITLHADGTGHFVSQVGTAPPSDIADLPPEGQDRDITVSRPALDRIFAIAQKEKGFAIKCDSGGSKVAFEGTKTLTYEGPDWHGACTYNYSNDQKLQWLTAEMEGIAQTLEEGRRLTVEHDHGRLTLDAELESLENEIKEGQATEIVNIAPILRTILADDNVMLRARRRAQALLDTDPATAPR
jgi:hypothetical protein